VSDVRQPTHVLKDWVNKIEEDGRGLTEWEENFVESVSEQLTETGSISLRQQEILEQIYAYKTP
jgi:hypothetical protein